MTTTATTPALALVRQMVGRRRRISRAEMAAILSTLFGDQLPEASTITGRTVGGTLVVRGQLVQHGDEVEATARAWAEMCRGICCISLWSAAEDDPGMVRYDAPGTLHPMQYAEVMFVPRGEDTDYLRRRAARVLIVAD